VINVYNYEELDTMQSEEKETEVKPSPQNNDGFKIKKSTFGGILAGVIVAIAVSTFFGGFFLGTLQDSDYVKKADLEALVMELEKNTVPTQGNVALTTPAIVKVSVDDDPVKGDSDAPITIVEFSDFQCPFCQRWWQNTLPQIEENYISTGKVKFVYRDFPLDSLHPQARTAHIASECADEQGKFWEYHDVLFSEQSQWNKLELSLLAETFTQMASDLGLEESKFQSCLGSVSIAQEVNKDYTDARNLGATGTPTFFVGNEKDGFTKLVGAQPYSAFQTVFDKLLAG